MSGSHLLLEEGLERLEVDLEGVLEVGDGEAGELVLVGESGVLALWAGVREHPGMHKRVSSTRSGSVRRDAGDCRAFDKLGTEGANGHGVRLSPGPGLDWALGSSAVASRYVALRVFRAYFRARGCGSACF